MKRLPVFLMLACLWICTATGAALGQTLTSDKTDYAPGETVTLTGTGWQPGEIVSVLLHEDPMRLPDITLSATTDISGEFVVTHVVEENDLGVVYTATATGQTSGLTATTTFTDAPAAGTAPVNPPTGGFGIDGDLGANTPTSGIGDWVPGSAGSGGNVLTAAGAPINPGTTYDLIDLWGGSAENNFAGGLKFDDNPNIWTWVNNPVLAKDDIHHGLIHFTTDPTTGHTWVMVAADRRSNNGDSYIDFEFLQNSLALTGGPTSGGFSSAGPNGGRTVNDFALTLELTKGGKQPGFGFSRWEAVGPGFDYVDRTADVPGSAVLAATNTAVVPVSFGAFGSTTYDANQFIEGAIDLTALLGAIDKCTSLGIKTILVKTKTSQSPTATIVDFIAPLSVERRIGLADAGPDQAKCANPFTVTGIATPAPGDAIGSTLWTVISGSAAITSASSPTTSVTVNGPSGSTATLRFTVHTTFGCTATDDVILTVAPPPACSITGPPGPVCPGTSSLVFSAPAGMASYLWTISGNGSISGPATGATVSVTAGAGCNTPFVLTLQFANAAGCSNACNTTVNVADTQAPVIAALPAASTIDCPATPVFAVATATDACGSAFTLTSADVTTPGACAGSYSVTRTWTALDACGNASTASQTINVQDITAPVIAALPAPSTIDCPATPVFAVATATDACGSAFTLTFADVTTPGACAGSYSVTRTWTATDACGNSSTAFQTINVQDNTAPVIASLPAPSTINCPDAPVFAVATAVDACGSAFTLTSADVTTPGLCAGSYSVTRTWTAKDACGNSSTASQTINVQDITAPVIAALPAPKTINCPAVPSFDQATATDACDPNVNLAFVDVTTAGSCAGRYSVTRTWTATDACGNSNTAIQTINVQDITPPVLVCPLDKQIECGASTDPGNTGAATATDACGTVHISFADTFVPGSCTNTALVTRTWTATDECGNVSACLQHINIVDTTKPVIQCVPDLSQCATGPGTILIISKPPVTDSCTPSSTITVTGVRSDGLPLTDPYPLGTTTITWSAKDDCGNQAEPCTQNVIITGSSICGFKFDDVNANGVKDGSEVGIGGWKITLTGPTGTVTVLTGIDGRYCFQGLALGTYTVTEVFPSTTPVWKATTPTSYSVNLSQCGQSEERSFGNVCLGAGGGLTLGFWSNKNGEAILKSHDALTAGDRWREVLNNMHCLRNANGTFFTISPTSNFNTAYSAFRNWLLNANATNMAYMLSAQLAAMELNVNYRSVSPFALVYEGPPPSGCSGTTFIQLGDPNQNLPGLLSDARLLLIANGNTTALLTQDRICQEYKKTAIDRANNNLNFVQAGPCTFQYGPSSEVPDIQDIQPLSQTGNIGQAGSGDEGEGLQSAYPNPFAGNLQISYAIGNAADAAVDIRIYNVAGRLVRTLVNGVDAPGRHLVIWDGRSESGDSAPHGIYFVRSRIGARSQTLQVIRLQ